MHRPEPADPIELLTGRWTIQRRLIDLGAGREGEFHGTAVFEPHGQGLRWTEHGRLRLGAHEAEAGRELAIVPAPHGWLVRFADGRPFHPLELSGGPVEHRCGDDRYVGAYHLLGPDALDFTWRVVGPRKQWRIDSSYRLSRCG